MAAFAALLTGSLWRCHAVCADVGAPERDDADAGCGLQYGEAASAYRLQM